MRRSRFHAIAGFISALVLIGCASSGSSTEKGGLVPFGPAGMTKDAAEPTRRALIIGIDEFEDERFPKLDYPTKDAQGLAAAIQGFSDVTVLTGRESTRRSRVLAALSALVDRARNRDDTVLVYFSTHGSLDRRPGEDLERYIITADSRLDLVASTAIAVSDVMAVLNRTQGRRVVLILATCHSGTGKSQLPDQLASALRGLKSPPVAPIHVVSEASFVLSAAAFGEAAREDERLGHDVYTHFLLEALRDGDRDQDGAVTVTEAHDFARERTYHFTGGRQRPSAESIILGVDPIVLAGKRARVARPTIYSYAASAEGLELSIDGSPKGTLPGGVAVEPGERVLELRRVSDGDLVYRGTIALAPGERTDLSALLPKPPEYVLSLGPTLFMPTSSTVRESYFPASFGLQLALRSRHLAIQHLVLEATFGWVYSSGDALDANEGLPFTLSAIRPGARAGIGLDLLAPLSFEATAGAGVLYAWRSFDTPTFEASESLLGPWLSGRIGLAWSALDWLRVGAELEVGSFWGTLGTDSGAQPFLGATLAAGARF